MPNKKETNKFILEALRHNGGIDTLTLEPRKYLDRAIVAARLKKATGCKHLVYDVDLLAQGFRCEGMTLEEAYEWIDYNTARAIPYMASPSSAEPILRYRKN